MKIFILLLILCTFNEKIFAQTSADTVIIKTDSTLISLFSRKLNYERHNLKYSMYEKGNVRDVFVFHSILEDLATGNKTHAVRIDSRANNNIFTDAPLDEAEYIDADELPIFIGYLKKIVNEVMSINHDAVRYTEYRFYTRGGIMLECYTGRNRWRVCLNYKRGSLGMSNLLAFDKYDTLTYINQKEDIETLINTLEKINEEIQAATKP